MGKAYKCPFCKKIYVNKKESLYAHMSNEHLDEMFDLDPRQVFFNVNNHKPVGNIFGKSAIYKQPTIFNLTTCRYEKFATEEERKEAGRIAKENMLRVHGKVHLLNEPSQQIKMLQSRSISGIYEWPDGGKTPYTGSYEKKFLTFLDKELKWTNSGDILGASSESPLTIPYVDIDGVDRFHIPDFYIPSLNLLINIKSSENRGYRLRDLDNELLIDEAIKKTEYNYIKILENNFTEFRKLVSEL